MPYSYNLLAEFSVGCAGVARGCVCVCVGRSGGRFLLVCDFIFTIIDLSVRVVLTLEKRHDILCVYTKHCDGYL